MRLRATKLAEHTRSRLRLSITLCATLGAATAVHAQTPALVGFWSTPSRAVVRIAPCGTKLCLNLVALPPGEPPKTDVHNPAAAQRGRPLCGLLIGEGFDETDPQHASGGHIYDPKSGHTYSGAMTAEGNLLKLRGYIGFSLFGRTEVWVRLQHAPVTCNNHGRSVANGN